MAIHLQSLGSKQVEGVFEKTDLEYLIEAHEIFYMAEPRYSIDAKRDFRSVSVRAPYC